MQIEIPTQCPCCSSTLVTVNDQLFCRNSACSAQLNKKIEHFAKVLSIKGLGPKTVEKLEINDITELYFLDKQSAAELLGSERNAEKLIDEIDRTRSADLAKVLAAFSIPLIGETASTKIASIVQHISEINEETCKQAGLGEKATQNLLFWIETEYEELKEFLPFSFKSNTKTDEKTKQTVCITGKLKSFKTKSEATKALEQSGYRVVDSVTKTLNYLVDESNDGSTKRVKAESYNIPIINDITELLKRK